MVFPSIYRIHVMSHLGLQVGSNNNINNNEKKKTSSYKVEILR